VVTAWELARAWPGAELIVIEDSGHTGSTAMRQARHAADDRLLARISENGDRATG
jgi:proline iminopeptidase